MKSPRIFLGLALACFALAWALPASAGEVSKSFSFEIGKWYELNATDGPTTLHRFRLERGSNTVTKITRGGSSEYAANLELQLEYTNEATSDWKAELVVEWLDGSGEVIDGFRDTKNLDEGDRHELWKTSITTLRYGLDRAKKVRVEIRFNPD